MIRHEYLLHPGRQSDDVELSEKMGDVGGNKKDMEFCVLKNTYMSSNHDPIKHQEQVIHELGVCKQESKRQRNKMFIWVNSSLRHANKGLNRVNLDSEVSCSVVIQPSVLAQLAWKSAGYKVISTTSASWKPKNEQFELIWAELQHSLYTCILIVSSLVFVFPSQLIRDGGVTTAQSFLTWEWMRTVSNHIKDKSQWVFMWGVKGGLACSNLISCGKNKADGSVILYFKCLLMA